MSFAWIDLMVESPPEKGGLTTAQENLHKVD